MTRKYKRSVSSIMCTLFIFDAVGMGAAAGGTQAPGASQASHATESQARRPRLVDYVQWLEDKDYQPASVFGFEQLTAMFAGLRESERLIETAHHTRDLLDRWWNNVELMVGEGEINDRVAAEAEARRAYDALVAEYERLRQAARQDGGAGLLGMISTLGVNILVSAVPGMGPVLGAAIAGGFGRAIKGGSFGEVLFAMGLAAGAAGLAQELTGAIGGADVLPTRGGLGVAKDASASVASGAVVAGATASFTVTQIALAIERDITGVPQGGHAGVSSPRAGLGPARSTFPGRDLERAPTVAAMPPLPVQDRWPAPALQPWAQAVVMTAVRDVASAARAAALSGGPPRRPSLASAVEDARWLGVAPPRPVLTGDRLLAIRADMRRVERRVDLAMHIRNLYGRYQRGLELLIQEAEINDLDARLAELIQEYEEVKAAYDDLRRELDKPDSGFFGAVFGFAMGIAGTIVGGPLLGAALAGAAGALADGGGVGDVLVAAGVSAGAAYVYQAAVPVLRDAMQGVPTTGAAPRRRHREFTNENHAPELIQEGLSNRDEALLAAGSAAGIAYGEERTVIYAAATRNATATPVGHAPRHPACGVSMSCAPGDAVLAVPLLQTESAGATLDVAAYDRPIRPIPSPVDLIASGISIGAWRLASSLPREWVLGAMVAFNMSISGAAKTVGQKVPMVGQQVFRRSRQTPKTSRQVPSASAGPPPPPKPPPAASAKPASPSQAPPPRTLSSGLKPAPQKQGFTSQLPRKLRRRSEAPRSRQAARGESRGSGLAAARSSLVH